MQRISVRDLRAHWKDATDRDEPILVAYGGLNWTAVEAIVIPVRGRRHTDQDRANLRIKLLASAQQAINEALRWPR